jgi:hypothetical protein
VAAANTFIARWDGATWSAMASPNPGPGPIYDGLNGVSASSANDVWAVGSYCASACDNHQGGARIQPLVVHWDGLRWAQVPSAQQSSDPLLSQFFAVAAISLTNAWAVGFTCRTNPSDCSTVQTLIEHWDGASWSEVTSPSPSPRNELHAIAVVGADDVWAVGYQCALVDCASGGPPKSLVEHWDGSAWTAVSGPDAGAMSTLRGVSAASKTDVWAVGSYSPSSGLPQVLLEHWNGSNWSQVPGPNQGGVPELLGVHVVSTDDVWAVGDDRSYGQAAQTTLIEHWDGSTWSAVATPNLPGYPGLIGVG